MRLVRLKPQGLGPIGPGPPGITKINKVGPRSTYKAFPLALLWSKLCKNSRFFT